jgi:hypothetical protein
VTSWTSGVLTFLASLGVGCLIGSGVGDFSGLFSCKSVALWSTWSTGVLGAGVRGESSLLDKTGECLTSAELEKIGTMEAGSKDSTGWGVWIVRVSTGSLLGNLLGSLEDCERFEWEWGALADPFADTAVEILLSETLLLMGFGDGGGDGKGAVFCFGLIARVVGILEGELDLKYLCGMFGVLELEDEDGW